MPRRKIRPFKLARNVRNKKPGYVYLRRGNRMVAIPLRTSRGLLNGVFETPRGKIVEIRFEPSLEDFDAIVDGKIIGTFSRGLSHRIIEPAFRKKGIGSELLDAAERSNTPWEMRENKTLLQGTTFKRDTAAFLARRGWRGKNSTDEALLNEYARKQQPDQLTPGIAPVSIVKERYTTQFDSPYRWHRIKVIGRHGKEKGKPIWLTIRVAWPTD